MSKNLKLVGLKSYTGLATIKEGKSEADVVHRGEIACFPDDIAEKIMDGGRANLEGDWISYWQAAPDDATPNHNFTQEKIKVEKLTDEQREMVLAASAKKPPQRVARRTKN